jgi:bcr-type benzoyl-CoA reductase subunit C
MMTDSHAFARLAEAARAPLETWPDRFPGHRAVGYLCSYVPEELIHAAGFTPIRLRGTTAPLRHVDGHLQSFTCALCRSTLDQVLTGNLAFLEGTVFAHTCDAMQAQADLWRMNSADAFVETVMQPANLGARHADIYLVSELERFRERLAAYAGRPVQASDIQASIALYNETRRLIAALQEKRNLFSPPEFYQILDAAQAMPRETFNPLLATLLSEQGVEPSRSGQLARSKRPRLFLAGAVLDEPGLFYLIEELGGHVVGDDLCSGSRHFYGRVDSEGDSLANLASYYLQRPPCPTKYHPDHDPGSHLLEQVELVQAQGVVFALEKFCEPHAFDFAAVQPALDHVGLPRLLLEMEQTPSLEALRTRLQAFIEML